jgi:hypothetical protein
LSAGDCWLNEIIADTWVTVKNTIAGVKRGRIVKDVFRNNKEGFSDLVMEIACALHNLPIESRHPLPGLSLGQ